jgi:UrcA family protein
MNNTPTLVTITALALFGCAVARADAVPEARSAVVQFADLNLNNTLGAAVLYQRIKGAAQNVCREPESRLLVFQERYRACVHASIAKALADVDRTSVTTYAARRGIAPASGRIQVARQD